MSAVTNVSTCLGLTTAEVSAGGVNQAAATQLSAAANVVTAGTVNQGVKLPAAESGDTVFVYNNMAVNIILYPISGATINGVGSVGIGLPAKTGAYVWAIDNTTWFGTALGVLS
jgi:hypothetical protein